MLIRPDATFIHELTNRAETVFPRGSDWLHFESQFPEHSVFVNSVLDSSVGLAGELGTRVFARADWQNWISTTKISLYEIGTRVGLPDLEGTGLKQGLATVYDNISTTASVLGRFDRPEEIIPELMKNAALQVVQQLSGQAGMIGQTVAQVLAAAVWAFDVVAAHKADELGKHISLPPMQTEDPATDSWQVNRIFEVLRSPGPGGVVFPDGGTEAASTADYTKFYLPAYRYNRSWTLQHRENGVAAQQGMATKARGPGGEGTSYNFDPGDGSTFGFMPGTATTLRVLQASYRLYHTVRGTPVNRYTIRCRGVDKGCRKTVKAFDGSRDCRQCVDAESVWPVKGIGWAYAGAPLNVTTPGENVGAFYPSTNKLLGNLLEQVSRPGPLLYTVNTTAIEYEWKKTFELFWEFARREWRRRSGSGWRGLISRLATLMTSFDDDGERRLGGREPGMPLKLIANPRESRLEVPFSASIFSRIIQPFCRDLSALQRHYLGDVMVAYVPPGAGALYAADGSVRRDPLGDRFLESRKALLASSKRMMVDLRFVSDPTYRAELKARGVKASPVNPSLFGSPGMGGGTTLLNNTLKSHRPPRRPKISTRPPLTSPPHQVAFIDPARLPGLGTGRGEVVRPGLAIGLTLGSVALTAATVLALEKVGEGGRE